MKSKRAPYLAFTLDAKKEAVRVAKATGVDVGSIVWGLLELWERVWGTKQDVVSHVVVSGCFGPDLQIREALVEFGFLEPVDNLFRVRGADEWLFRAEAASKAGKASAAAGKSLSNLKQNHRTTTEQTELLPNGSPNSHRTDSERTTEQTPNPTQHPAPSTFLKAAPAGAADSRPAQMLEIWNAASTGRIPKARDSEDRRPKLKRWLEKHSLEEWRLLCARVNASPLLRGDKGEWRATLDWVLKPANLTKILDGNYDDGPSTAAAPAADPCSEPGCDRDGLKEFSEGRLVCQHHFDELYAAWMNPKKVLAS